MELPNYRDPFGLIVWSLAPPSNPFPANQLTSAVSPWFMGHADEERKECGDGTDRHVLEKQQGSSKVL